MGVPRTGIEPVRDYPRGISSNSAYVLCTFSYSPILFSKDIFLLEKRAYCKPYSPKWILCFPLRIFILIGKITQKLNRNLALIYMPKQTIFDDGKGKILEGAGAF